MALHDENVVWHSHPVTVQQRELHHGHRGVVLWFTGLSGSGKSTVAGALEEALHKLGVSTYLLDGDNVRHGLCSDLGFSDADRKENIRRVGEVANLMVEAGLVVLTAFISPHRAKRQIVRERVGEGRFIEVFVDTPLAICEARDPKGLYKKARAGELRNFTGIDSVYEAPESAEIHLNGEQLVTNLVQQLLDLLEQDGSDPETPPGFHARFVKVTGSNMRNSHNITLTNNDSLTEDEETTWSLPGAVVGFISWLFALAMPMLIYGSTRCSSLSTPGLSSALTPVAVVVGIAPHFIDGRKATLQYCFHPGDSRHYVWCTVYVATGLICTFPSPLFIIQTVTNNEIMFCTPWVYVTMDKCGTFARVVAVSPTEDVELSSDAWDDDAVFQGAGWVN